MSDFPRVVPVRNLLKAEMKTETENPVHNHHTSAVGTSIPLREEISWSNFHRHLQIGAIPLLSLPVLSLYGIYSTNLQWNTLLLCVAYYTMTILSITAGYHRCFSHKAYKCATPLKVLLLCAGAGTGEGSAKWWVRGHRAHHRYSDTDQDPYGVHEGFFHAHFGWMIFTARFKPGHVDMTDISKDKYIQFQHKNYPLMFLIFAFVIPILIAGLGWSDWRGGFFYACCVRMTIAHHATFCVNSVAHYLGEASYDDVRSPRDHILTALLTHGEGYHNFHHEFPNDYRNAIRWYQYDPTKVFIWCCSLFGLVSDLNRTGDQVIAKSALQMEQKTLDKKKDKLAWPQANLPVMDREHFEKESQTRRLVVCDGFVHDVEDFASKHPGGKLFIVSNFGKDVSEQFNGAVYKHSNSARNVLNMMRVAVYLPEDSEDQFSVPLSPSMPHLSAAA